MFQLQLFFLLHCDEWDRVVALPRHKFVTGATSTWTIETKLPRNDHWKVLPKFYILYADRKSKMAATAIHKLTLDLAAIM
jgi:hypothetical protein